MINARANFQNKSEKKLVEARNQIAFQQSALLANLISGASPPAGFDRKRLEIFAKTLQYKRLRTILTIYPWLEQAIGKSLEDEIITYVQRFPLAAGSDASSDARGFLKYARVASRIKQVLRQSDSHLLSL